MGRSDQVEDTIIIGGGASGMMTALLLSREGKGVTLVEKNEKLGKKLYITGKGRCNLTNLSDVEEHLSSVCSNKKFLYSSLYGFTPYDTVELFNSLGLKTKVERGNRVFPVSDHSSDVIKALKRELISRNVRIMLNSRVIRLLIKGTAPTGEGQVKPSVEGVLLSDGQRLYSKNIVVSTGGLSYPSTGSDGDGYKFAVSAGMSVINGTPSLVPLGSPDEDVRELMGLSLKNAGINITLGKKSLYRDFGELLFTHFGVSGPVILSASARIRPEDFGSGPVLHIDLKNALDEKTLDKRLIRVFEENRLKEFKNSLGSLFPSKLIPVMVKRSGIEGNKKCAGITREERERFLREIKDFKVNISGLRGFDEAVVTKGGVSVSDVDPKTMESKKVSGLYFTGEVLDIDSITGGFNLQLAWSTAASAARGIIENRR